MTLTSSRHTAGTSGSYTNRPPWSVLAVHNGRFGKIEIIEYRPDDQHLMTIRPQDSIVEMLLHNGPIRRFAEFQSVPGRYPLGNAAFFFTHERFVMEWQHAAPVRALRCNFSGTPVERARTFTQEELIAGLTISSPVLTRALNGVAAELYRPGFQSPLLLESLSAQIAVEMGRFFRRRIETDGLQLTNAQMVAINQRIEAEGPWPTAEILAETCNLSKRHFFRLFRRTTNLSPSDYVMLCRIERAKQMLREDRLIIKQIAFSCGFSSASAFSAAFRRATGATPREFQDSAKG